MTPDGPTAWVALYVFSPSRRYFVAKQFRPYFSCTAGNVRQALSAARRVRLGSQGRSCFSAARRP
ncbi:hypothetical protein PsYK624_151620 [Phanerochaete sordida]|uniref:Uncharacterized protein n=1 Tax=Phanerochaete sordida TaxID=48140 RepID=A0A9P3GSV3_9APHY|nr:hypothetical protein PsYK624_151620 [Phanerochaete sordida]